MKEYAADAIDKFKSPVLVLWQQELKSDSTGSYSLCGRPGIGRGFWLLRKLPLAVEPLDHMGPQR